MSHYEDDDDSTVDPHYDASPDFQNQYRQKLVGGEGNYSPAKYDPAIDALKKEVKHLREALSVTSQGTLEANYLAQLRKNRELNVKYETEKTTVTKLQNQIVQLERQKLEEERDVRKGICLPSQRMVQKDIPPSPTKAEESHADTKEKLDRSQKMLISLRKHNDEMKRDIHKMKKVLLQELGDETTMEKALDDYIVTWTADSKAMGGKNSSVLGPTPVASSGWRGRAQQIVMLKAKIKEFERQKSELTGSIAGDNAEVLSNPDTGGGSPSVTTGVYAASNAPTTRTTMTTATGARDFDDVARQVIHAKEETRKLETRELQMRLKQKELDVEKEKTKADSIQARLQILERDNQHLRLCLSRIVEKTENDDRLIATYREELEQKKVEMRRALTAKGSTRDNMVAATSQSLESSRLQDTVVQLRRELKECQRKLSEHTQGGGSLVSPWKTGGRPQLPPAPAFLENDDLISNDERLIRAKEVVEIQRNTILVYEMQLERRDLETSEIINSKGNQLNSAVREENIGLKERLRALTNVMEKEIELHKALAAAAVQQNANTTPPRPPAVAGRRKSAGLNPRKENLHSEEKQHHQQPPAVSTLGDHEEENEGENEVQGEQQHEQLQQQERKHERPHNVAMQEEFEQLKQQYAELKRSNLSQARLQTPPSTTE